MVSPLVINRRETEHVPPKKWRRGKGKTAAAEKGKNRHIASLESIGERNCDGIVMNDGGFHSFL